MSDKVNDGGSAFPSQTSMGDVHEGMTLRDYFAAKSMHAHQSHNNALPRGLYADEIAKSAYAMADAMLKAREQ